MIKNKCIVHRPGIGSGLGSNLISLARLFFFAKKDGFSLVIDWSNRSRLRDKDINLFWVMFYLDPWPKEIVNINIGSWDEDSDLSVEELLSGKWSGVRCVRNFVSGEICRTCCDSDEESVYDFFSILHPRKKESFLKELNGHIPFASVHIRHGNGEFERDINYWKRSSFVTRQFPRLVARVLKNRIKNKKDFLGDKKEVILVFSDNNEVLDAFSNEGYFLLSMDDSGDVPHQVRPEGSTDELQIEYYQKACRDIYIMSFSKYIFSNGSAFSRSSYYMSCGRAEYRSINKEMLWVRAVDAVISKISRYLPSL